MSFTVKSKILTQRRKDAKERKGIHQNYLSWRSWRLGGSILLFLLSACQPQTATLLPTPAPTITPRSALVLRPTSTPQAVATVAPPTARPSPTRWPFGLVLTPGSGPPVGTLEPAFLTQVAAHIELPATTIDFEQPFPTLAQQDSAQIGTSVEGRPIVARAFGGGERVLLLAGGMHGGWEANTVELMDEMLIHFEAHPDDVLPGIRIVIIPVVNPDGLVRGRTPEGRFNVNGVDLNRNWECDWSPEAVWRNMPVNAGAGAFSEPESAALAQYIRSLRPMAALFYHSAAGGIFAGACRGDHGSAALSAVLGEATDYTYGEDFDAYAVTGAASNWADGLGIASADVELATWTDSEFERNLRGIMAVQRWLTGIGLS
jgi:hypothetical protein